MSKKKYMVCIISVDGTRHEFRNVPEATVHALSLEAAHGRGFIMGGEPFTYVYAPGDIARIGYGLRKEEEEES